MNTNKNILQKTLDVYKADQHELEHRTKQLNYLKKFSHKDIAQLDLIKDLFEACDQLLDIASHSTNECINNQHIVAEHNAIAADNAPRIAAGVTFYKVQLNEYQRVMVSCALDYSIQTEETANYLRELGPDPWDPQGKNAWEELKVIKACLDEIPYIEEDYPRMPHIVG